MIYSWALCFDSCSKINEALRFADRIGPRPRAEKEGKTYSFGRDTGACSQPHANSSIM